MEHNNSPSWSYDWLPVEILEMVILYLPDFASFRSCRLVNCLWYTMTHELSEKYWKLKYEYYFGGPKEEGQSDEDAFIKNQQVLIKEYKQFTGMNYGILMIEQSLTIWAKKLGHNAFIHNIVLNQKKLKELLSLPDYSEKTHSQWFYNSKRFDDAHLIGGSTATHEKQRAVIKLSRQEIAERKKKIAFYNYMNNDSK